MVIQDRAKATRGAIVVGAAAVFEEHGYGSASLTQVSETAGVTKGALYFHFQSKEDLARAVIEEQHRIVVAESESILAGDLARPDGNDPAVPRFRSSARARASCQGRHPIDV